MENVINLYCDESSHMENDHRQYMVLGYLHVLDNQKENHRRRLKGICRAHHIGHEFKWSHISSSNAVFYQEIVRYFFESDMQFRAVVVDKTNFRNSEFHQSFDTFYFKMYYQLLRHPIDQNFTYNIYLDYKDELSKYKVEKLREILQSEVGAIQNFQSIRSHETVFLQLCDVFIGALGYHLNFPDGKVMSKVGIIEQIKDSTQQTLDCTSSLLETKFNIFLIQILKNDL